ncbi:hypothetical protein K5X82_14210 [Halosquirtibacter xylanolyticus]|uniref:hypothetical protein n=1 Tax=Halosquirtibacter xylanolyticus TaxID=3374599 RepID=UPI003747A1AB|nr:hypothetical protein K5X82_14210 [Prolixibacteraceae bacterium]
MNKTQIEKHLDFVRKDIDHLVFLLDNLTTEDKIVPSRIRSIVNKCDGISDMLKLLLDENDGAEINQTEEETIVDHKPVTVLEEKKVEQEEIPAQAPPKPEEVAPTQANIQEPEKVETPQPVEDRVADNAHTPTKTELKIEAVENSDTPEPKTEETPQPTPSAVSENSIAGFAQLRQLYNNIYIDPAVVAFLAPKEERQIALNLNDRLMYVRDLFAGDMERLNSTMEKLNSTLSEQEALVILSEVSQWKEEPAHQSFLEQVKRKFI